MTNGREESLHVRLVRGLAVLTKKKYEALITEVNERTDSRFPRELVEGAIEMAPLCTFKEVLCNLEDHITLVFERILKESLNQEAITEAKKVWERPWFPRARAACKIIGPRYRQHVIQRFRQSPCLSFQLVKRVYFMDYLFQTGIFNS